MIIGIFTDTFYPEINGVATSCLNLYQQLQKMGHTVHVYAPKCKGWEEFLCDFRLAFGFCHRILPPALVPRHV